MYIGTPQQHGDKDESARLRKRVARLEQTVEELRNAILLLTRELGGGRSSDDFDEGGSDDAEGSVSASSAAS